MKPVVHLEGCNAGKRACDESKPAKLRTDDAKLVTCSRCKQTNLFETFAAFDKVKQAEQNYDRVMKIANSLRADVG